MADVILASRPSASQGAGSSRSVYPLMIPASAQRSLGPALPPMAIELERQLHMNQQRYLELDAYYRGEHRHSFSSDRFLQAFGRQLRDFADNWMRMIVRATVNRMKIQGFRAGDSNDEGTSELDLLAWRFWQANRMGQQSRIAHRDAQKFGTSFVMVDPSGDPNLPPVMSVESPYQVIGQRDAVDRTRLVSAVKKWVGLDGHQYLNFYVPEGVMKFRSIGVTQGITPNDQSRLLQGASWIQVGEVANPLGVVPIVPIENEPDLMVGGVSDLDDLIPLNDWLNKTIRDALVASEFQGFRQRWATGVEVPKDPVTGKPITDSHAQLRAAQSNVWMFSNADAKVGDFAQVDVTGHIALIQEAIHHLSMVSSTPAYMLVGKMANMSADAILAAELGFVGKIESKQQDTGPAWGAAQELSLAARGHATPNPVEVVWDAAEARSGSVLANELAILAKLGMPQDEVFQRAGYSPATIARWKASGMMQSMQTDAAAQISPGPMDKGAPDS